MPGGQNAPKGQTLVTADRLVVAQNAPAEHITGALSALALQKRATGHTTGAADAGGQ